tara:strand:+ start:9110 stop:9682 length:573 start_codon:yes stop_codon:yes gene_type:complete
MIELKENNNFYVITGGPGVGKTSLLEELGNRQYKIVPEIARELIREQQESNGEALPWKDKELYKEIMFRRSLNSYEQAEKNINGGKPIFFDRGFLDTLCYSKLIRSEIDERMEVFAGNWKYNKSVFILQPWHEIYTTDKERKQDWEEAVLTYEKMCETYKSYGYDMVEVPKKAISERADFVLEFIGKNKI